MLFLPLNISTAYSFMIISVKEGRERNMPNFQKLYFSPSSPYLYQSKLILSVLILISWIGSYGGRDILSD